MNATLTEPKIATEQGHWYARDGAPCYTYTNKKGEEKNTTLREARKFNLVPSVTTVTSIKAKPGLNNWKERQILLAALTLPRRDGEDDEAFADRVLLDARAQAKAAADRGTALHGQLERGIRREPVTLYADHIWQTFAKLREVGIEPLDSVAEHSFAHPLGFGGKVDAHADGWVVDFKTKDAIEPGKRLAYDQNVQLAAYAHGLGLDSGPRCLNVFIGVNDGNVVVHEWTRDQIQHGWEVFQACLRLWKLENNYDGGF